MVLLTLKMVFRRKKITCTYIIIFILFFLVFYTLLNARENLTIKIEKEIIQKRENREIYIEYDSNVLDSPIQILKNKYKVEKITNYFDSISIYDEIYGHIKISRYLDNEVKIIDGKKLNENNCDEIIIPRIFHKNGNEYNYENMLERNIILESNNKDKYFRHEFKVTGIYENKSNSIINELYTTCLEQELNQKMQKYIVTFLDEKDTRDAIRYLKNIGYQVSLLSDDTQAELGSYLKLTKIIDAFIHLLLLIIALIIYMIIKSFINYQNKNIAMMKTFGFSMKTILFNITLSMLLIILISYLCSMLLIALYNISLIVIRIKSNFIITNAMNLFYIVLFVIISIVIAILLHYKQIKRICIIKLLHKS